MFRLWGKLFYNNHMLADSTIVNDDPNMTRTKKVFAAIDTLCHDFDLSQPIWLESNIQEFKRHSRTRFRQDNFMAQIDFDYFEIQIIEED